MSGREVAAQPSRDKNLELVRAMGAEWYDPIPTEQYTCFLDEEFTLTPRAHRMLACVRSHTIKGKKGGRTPYMHEGKRAMLLKDVSAELGLDASATLKVWGELEANGLVRRDEKGRLWLCGKVKRKERTHGEDANEQETEGLDPETEWKKFCTDNLPQYLAKQFQQLTKNKRPQATKDFLTWKDYEKTVEAAAMYAAREGVQKARDKDLAGRYGIKVRRHEKKEPKPEKTPVVQLSLLWLPELSVQNFGEEIPYNVKNESVHNRSNKEFKESENKSAGQAGRQRTTTDSEMPASLPLAAIRDFFPNEALLDADLRRLDAHLAAKLGAEYDRHAFIAMVGQRAARKIRAGLLFDFEKGLARDFCETRVAARARDVLPERKLPAMTTAEQVASLEGLLTASPSHSQALQWREELERLQQRKGADSEGRPMAKAAGTGGQ
jgi:hypothetical protein